VRRAIFAALVAAQSSIAAAGEVEIFNQLWEEVSACAAYYTFARQCAPSESSPSEIAKLESSGDAATKLATTFGRFAGMSNAAIAVRLTMSLQAAAMAMKADCANFSALREKYRDACAALLDSPIKRLE
jgi:hypothetical protein